MSKDGKKSKRRPIDEEAYAENYQKIFRMKQQEEWREDEVQADEEKHLGTVRCRWCKFKQQKPDSVLCESCGKEVTV